MLEGRLLRPVNGASDEDEHQLLAAPAMSAAPSVEMSAKGVSPAATTTAAASAPARGRLAALYHFADNTDYALIASGCLFKLAFGATLLFVINTAQQHVNEQIKEVGR